MKKFFLCMLIGLTATYTAAAQQRPSAKHKAVPLEECAVIRPQTNATELQADFQQRREIAGLNRSLDSSGRLHITLGESLRWETRNPIASVVQVDKEGLEIFQEKNGVLQQTKRYDEGAFRQLGALLLSLHSLRKEDLEKLKQHFELRCVQSADKEFTLLAKPQQRRLKKALKQITIRGSNAPEQIEIIDAQGDRSTITLEYRER